VPKHEDGYSENAVTFEEVARAAYEAGFRQPELEKALATAYAESGLDQTPDDTSKMDAHAYNTNANGSHDRGTWQLNDATHPDLAPQQAYDVTEAAKAACDLSKHGKNWGPWKASTGTPRYKDALAGPARRAANNEENRHGRAHQPFNCWCGTEHGAHEPYEFDCTKAKTCWCGQQHCYKGH